MPMNIQRYAAITANYWGAGKTPDEALKNMRAAGGRENAKRYGYLVVATDDAEFEIDTISGGVLVHDGYTAAVITDTRARAKR